MRTNLKKCEIVEWRTKERGINFWENALKSQT